MKLTTTSTNPLQLAWWSSDAIVYFIGAGRPIASVKIGVTIWKSAKKRLAAIQSSNHEQLELIGVLPFRGTPYPMKEAEDRERLLHAQFRELQRFPEGSRGCEWFTAAPEFLMWIEANSKKPEEFDFVRFVSMQTGPKTSRQSQRPRAAVAHLER